MRGLLDALCAGGIYDHLGGGFARYSTDAEWRVPHFEKMLYDNAQILELLALAHAETPTPLYAARARETFGWLMREMRAEGAFAASLDADSEGEEGRFYVWSADEIDARPRRRRGGVQGRLRRQAGRQLGGPQRAQARDAARRRRPPRRGSPAPAARLFARAREARPAGARRQDPRRLERPDDRRAGARRRRVRRARISRRRARRVRLRRRDACATATAGSSTPGAPAASARAGMLDDYAAMARAALSLFEATGEPRLSRRRDALGRGGSEEFGAEDGGLYLTARDAGTA